MAIANALAGDDSLDSAERRPPAGLAVFICGLVLGAALGISLTPPSARLPEATTPPLCRLR